MSRENFRRLLQRYSEGRCTPEEAQLVDHWYEMLEGTHDSEITPENLDAIEDSIWDKIQRQIDHSVAAPVQLRRRTQNVRFWLVAASVTALLVTCATFVYYRIICDTTQPTFVAHSVPEQDINVVTNQTLATLPVLLPDQSLVELYPGAVLEYPTQFKGEREVKLMGDAIFTVEADPKNPFWVFHEGMITKVIGTKFKIKAPKGEKQGEVIVYTGKVDVYYNAGGRSLVKRVLSPPDKASLTANQRAILVGQEIAETIVDDPVPIDVHTAAAQQKPFEDTPLPTLASALSELYALEVKADGNLADITFTGDISGLGLFEQLNIICAVTNTHYNMVGTTITIHTNTN